MIRGLPTKRGGNGTGGSLWSVTTEHREALGRPMLLPLRNRMEKNLARGEGTNANNRRKTNKRGRWIQEIP